MLKVFGLEPILRVNDEKLVLKAPVVRPLLVAGCSLAEIITRVRLVEVSKRSASTGLVNTR